MASDTNVSWILTRILANTLINPPDPTSIPNVTSAVLHKFALNSLSEFEDNGYEPVYPNDFVLPPPTPEQMQEAMPYHNTPRLAVDFFTQLGDLVATNPIPSRETGLSGTPLTGLPAWVVPQYGATTIYRVPSAGQKRIFHLFAPLGLTKNGFTVPAGWGNKQLLALQAGYVLGQHILREVIDLSLGSPDTHYWGILNNPVGTYPSNFLGYLYRSAVVVEGGVANVGLDAIYPTLVENPSSLDGNLTYKLTFKPPTSSPTLPAVGIYPPMVNDASGNPKGFWSINLYATDPTEGDAPFIAQTSVLNTSYSTADTAVVSVDSATDSMTVNPPNWGTLIESTPILFGGNAGAFGLRRNKVYYVAGTPQVNADNTYTFQISSKWIQTLSPPRQSPDPGNRQRRRYRPPAGANWRRPDLWNGQAGESAWIVTTHRRPVGQERRWLADPVVRPNAA